MTVWDSVGHKLTGGGCWKGLCAVTQVTALHIVHHIAAHHGPPKVTGDKLSCFPPLKVAWHWVIMVDISQYWRCIVKRNKLQLHDAATLNRHKLQATCCSSNK